MLYIIYLLLKSLSVIEEDWPLRCGDYYYFRPVYACTEYHFLLGKDLNEFRMCMALQNLCFRGGLHPIVVRNFGNWFDRQYCRMSFPTGELDFPRRETAVLL